jgi:hypothetical protein
VVKGFKVSVSELRTQIGLNARAADDLLADHADILQKTPVAALLDLSLFDERTFESTIVPLLLLETQKLYKEYKDTLRFILKGDKARINAIFREARKRDIPAGQFLLETEEDLPVSFQENKARFVNVTSSVSSQSQKGRFVYVKPLGQNDVLDLAAVLKLAIVEAVVEPNTSAFDDFIRVFKYITRLELSDTQEFRDVIEGRLKDHNILAKYTITAQPIDIQYALRIYQLMIKMAEQAA